MAKTYSKKDIEEMAIKIVDNERTLWKDEVYFITENIGFNMRNLIRTCRKNYWGIFEEPVDPNSGRDKVFAPLTMAVVEDKLKNVDIDFKNIGFKTNKHAANTSMASVARLKVHDTLGKMYIGETIDADQRTALIDGTTVWKTWENPDTKIKVRRKTIDVLNCYIDPSEESIYSAYRFTVRDVPLVSEIKRMDGWMNTDSVVGSTSVSNVGSDLQQSKTGVRQDAWDMWGKIPKWLITGKTSDQKEIDGHIIVSGLETGDVHVHLIEENINIDRFGVAIKPYEEWRASKIANRWHGLGDAERSLALQEYLNIVLNVRINKSYISQLGLFKVKKGRGITAQMLSRLPSNGAIPVTDHDDIEQFNVLGPDATSYKDEEVIEKWTQRITSTFPVTSGEQLPASATATSAAISNRNAKSAFTMFKENTGLFISRWIERHVLPIEAKYFKVSDIVKIDQKDGLFKDISERVVGYYAQKKLDEMIKKNEPIDVEMFTSAVTFAQKEISKRPTLFLSAVEKIISDDLDVDVVVTNEETDVPVTVSNLLGLLPIAPEYKSAIVSQVFDLLGLEKPSPEVSQQPQQQPQQPQQPQGSVPQPSELLKTIANGQQQTTG